MKPPAHQIPRCQGLGGVASTSLGSPGARDQSWGHSLVSEPQFTLASHPHPPPPPLPSPPHPSLHCPTSEHRPARFSGRARWAEPADLSPQRSRHCRGAGPGRCSGSRRLLLRPPSPRAPCRLTISRSAFLSRLHPDKDGNRWAARERDAGVAEERGREPQGQARGGAGKAA